MGIGTDRDQSPIRADDCRNRHEVSPGWSREDHAREGSLGHPFRESGTTLPSVTAGRLRGTRPARSSLALPFSSL